jgi:hypothetical protein
MASIDDKSFEPDQEPKLEGSLKMKHSPSVAEILPDGFSEGTSIGYTNDKRKASLTKSPGRLIANITDNEDDGYTSLNREKGNLGSNRKI